MNLEKEANARVSLYLQELAVWEMRYRDRFYYRAAPEVREKKNWRVVGSVLICDDMAKARDANFRRKLLDLMGALTMADSQHLPPEIAGAWLRSLESTLNYANNIIRNNK